MSCDLKGDIQEFLRRRPKIKFRDEENFGWNGSSSSLSLSVMGLRQAGLASFFFCRGLHSFGRLLCLLHRRYLVLCVWKCCSLIEFNRQTRRLFHILKKIKNPREIGDIVFYLMTSQSDSRPRKRAALVLGWTRWHACMGALGRVTSWKEVC